MKSMSAQDLLERGRFYDYTIHVLRESGFNPKRRLGQNFIVSRRIAETFYEAVSKLKGSVLFEFGTGLGVLTYHVGKKINRTIITVERDPRLYELAQRILAQLDNVIMVLGDGLRLLDTMRCPSLFSSTPYNLSSQIILKSARNNNIADLAVGVQREVAGRLVSRPGRPSFGRLSVISQLIFDIELLAVYPPSFFYPPPEVSGALLYMKRKKKYDEKVHNIVEKLTGCAFSYRNKLAMKILRSCISDVLNRDVGEEDLSRAGIKGNWRVRDIPPEIFELIAREGVTV